jgi:hypothetical protein
MIHVTCGVFNFCGYDAIQSKHYHLINTSPKETLEGYLKDLEDYVRKLDEAPLFY